MISLDIGESFSRENESVYRDVQKEILDDIICQIRGGIPWRETVSEHFKKSNKWLCDIITHPNRDLFFRLYPPPANAWVLDVGSGWGQIALSLARGDHKVCALEPTTERLHFIQAAAEQEGIRKKMFFLGCNYQDVEFSQKFDLITAIGVLEWCAKFEEGGDPQVTQLNFLKKCRTDLKDGGCCVIGIENRFGLKYWLGVAGDHTGVSGIEIFDAHLAKKRWQQENQTELRTFIYTMAEYRDMLTDAGFREISFFAAFPDYKLPQVIIPTDGLDLLAEFLQQNKSTPEYDGSNGQILPDVIQEDLKSHYRSLAKMRIAQYFVPSYFIKAS
jgi:2-polyprenyl-3-methyl-5-hydroxy-6-metoxy-1,4-benzoquinol methylase